MGFSKLINCDKSDMSAWARSVPAQNFIREIRDLREVRLRKLIDKPSEAHAESVKAFDKILDLIEGVQ